MNKNENDGYKSIDTCAGVHIEYTLNVYHESFGYVIQVSVLSV
jgi:hypothetical protein